MFAFLKISAILYYVNIYSLKGMNIMPKYIGQPCTSCRNIFKDSDEIVVCPQCGSPYHKDCYKLEGKCINTLLHESGSDWHPEPVIIPGASRPETVCPNCGAHNSAEALFCTTCGRSLDAGRFADSRPAPQHTPQSAVPNQQYDPYGSARSAASPLLNVQTVSADTDVDSNTVGEYTKYVGVKYYYYIPKFLKFAKQGGKASFNVPAFFFPHVWFFYRKMPIHGIIVMILSLITSIPTLLEYFVEEAGIMFTYAPGFQVFSLLCSLLSWTVTIVCAVFGNYMYYKKAKSDIDRIKANNVTPLHVSAALEAKGGTSMLYVLLSFVAVFAISVAFTIVMMSYMMVV